MYTGVWTGQHPKAEVDDNLPEVDQVFRVTVRDADCDGNQLLFPDLEVEVYWTNLCEQPENVIDLYHDHGTSEQFHSELKTDMDFERFPSGKIGVNKIILQLAMIAFNILRLIGQKALSFREDLPYKHKGRLFNHSMNSSEFVKNLLNKKKGIILEPDTRFCLIS
ncbi:MAG: hypothetical protein B6241_01205 [Spirochaetaceae bacterium 4572_59]|nr:MAG: hypothetical protein B6241_01205 [Spirochaetaceae bacterium 4572_59]